ncbi:MAG: HNH endonuclease signature motif containing protein [Ferruginibacter sp.]
MSNEKREYPKEFLEYVQSITNKRAKIVIDHILLHGFITTEDLENTYGYSHPPRAARDVREAGIPLITFKAKSEQGKSIAAYKFGNLLELQTNRIAGRVLFSKDFKTKLFEFCKGKCFICSGKFEERYLQVDHRVPYEVGGDLSVKNRDIKDYMLLCGSCNRAKSWSCEHCENWHATKDPKLCINCYWGNPGNYTHIALNDVRRLDIQWSGSEVNYYDVIKKVADQNKIQLPDLIKKIISENKFKL